MSDNTSKPRAVKEYEQLDPKILEQIKLTYPYGFSEHLIRFTNQKRKYISALPFETNDKYFLVKMTSERAEEIIEDDMDYDDYGTLKEEVQAKLAKKYAKLDYIKPVEEPEDDF